MSTPTPPPIEISPRLRFGLYLLCTLGAVVVVYLSRKGIVGADELEAWAGISGIATLLAAANVPRAAVRRRRRRRATTGTD